MTDMSHGKLSGEPVAPAARARPRSRKPGLRIDFDSETDPLAGLPEPPGPAEAGDADEAADAGDVAINAPPPLAGAETLAASDPGPAGAAPAAARAPDPPGRGERAAPRATPKADAMAAARAAGVPAALARIEVTLTVEVGRRRMALSDILASGEGEVIALDRLTDEPVDILVNGKPFARGEIVAVGDAFGVRLLALVDPGSEP